MTQEWFESADLEKKAPKTTSENQPEETETVKPVDTDIQASEAKVKNLINKALESPYIPEIDPHKTARIKEEISLFFEPSTKKAMFYFVTRLQFSIFAGKIHALHLEPSI